MYSNDVTEMSPDWSPVPDLMTTLVSHQAVPPHFTTKLRPWMAECLHSNKFNRFCSFPDRTPFVTASAADANNRFLIGFSRPVVLIQLRWKQSKRVSVSYISWRQTRNAYHENKFVLTLNMMVKFTAPHTFSSMLKTKVSAYSAVGQRQTPFDQCINNLLQAKIQNAVSTCVARFLQIHYPNRVPKTL